MERIWLTFDKYIIVNLQWAWRKDQDWDYEVLDEIPGVDMSKMRPREHYSEEKYAELTKELKKERVDWLAKFPELYLEIRDAV